MLRNVTTGADLNEIGTAGVRGQLLFRPNESFRLRVIGDYSSFDYDLLHASVFRRRTTLKSAARQYPALAAGQNYLGRRVQRLPTSC